MKGIKYIPTTNTFKFSIPADPDIEISGYRPRYTSQQPRVQETKTPVQETTPIQEPTIITEAPVEEVIVTTPAVKSITKPADNFSAWFTQSGVDNKYLDYFRAIGTRESSLNPKAVNRIKAAGLFQFMPSTLSGMGVNRETFINNPALQMQVMKDFTEKNLAQFTKEERAKAKRLGYSDSALAAGAHLGGVGGVRRFLKYGKDAKDMNGTSVSNYMDQFNNLF